MSRSALPLNAIYAFLVTARHLNLTRAASELCITQGAVSRKIATLESWLGFALFTRHARGLHLTEQGAALLPELQQGFAMLVNATEKASRSNAAIRLKAPTCAMRWLVPRLVALEQQRPDIHVALTTTLDHGSQLDNFDAAIVFGPTPAGSICLFEERLTPVMASSVTPPSQIDELAKFTFLHPTQDSRDWQLWLAGLDAALPMARNQHFATMDLAISAAIQGFGVTVADVTLVQNDVLNGRLIAPFAASVATGASYSLLQRAEKDAPPFLPELVAWLSEV
ncbi:LysR family transcriptional regulator, glycine cleavage system transcriptional activator [Candidatus Pantoea symbiotica]|jgi:LysR family glycine cleavage system transcriptional activator|uniref:LysR family transcriptional regulator, glycine cleavage system transcriptional activator n=1 Tax=Candidatus Pantoea symbiotica TaxID=1884370 RepID=A0A1I3TTG8_9GAMM|nr:MULTISPECIES: LysR substrate-binding domain-containing protein [Pantoea]KAJ9433045.1 LysR substrate-binding domain-containing protein [Pantoea sp. YR343]MRT25353.1 LysR family transcriptional regulator [Enterobacteriaceae bacterium RIT697]SFJ73910.1 LysR family transcriptional regulator, glycine cleavage system transcriptional activator [Pantoea symbiotica]SFU46936.1 LysR family transcriptional regulator, glycine cleavage system transcriptional activator [Pantoea sp. YR525]